MGEPEWHPRSNPWVVAIVVTIAAFMEILDTTIVNVALPHIAGSLSSSSDEATWALTSYLVANGIVLTISGWLGNVLGRKRYFLICIAMFTVCSFLCGTSSSLGELIIFRLMQGFFGGGLQPNQQSIILDYFPPERRGAAFGVTAVAIIVAPILGPTLGGYITDSTSWRWIFYINVPVGIIAVVLVSLLVEDPPWARERRRTTDFIGLGLIAIGLGCLQIMLDRGEDENWFSSSFIVIMAMIAVSAIVGAILWLMVAKKPIVHLAVFKDNNFAAGCGMISAMGGILYASAVLIPQFAQQVIGYTATWAGLILSPGGIVVLFLIPVVGRLMTFIQTRYVIAFGFFTLGCAFLYSRVLTPDIDFIRMVLLRSSQSAALAFLFVPISTIAYRTLPRELNGDATALYSMFRNVAGSVGIAISTATVQQSTQIHEAYLSRWATPLHQPFQQLIATYQAALQAMGHVATEAHALAVGKVLQDFRIQAAVLAYSDVFFYCSFVAFAMVPFCFLMSPTKSGGGGVGAH
ncbi:MAG: DHA2 family efflux MFS transporter permease subunit [Beijerinckiaceae bacterium]|nr:MAG: DHA2 family efflux MFS transporter permease subunit [Beijerinckiaceae bacterium]